MLPMLYWLVGKIGILISRLIKGPYMTGWYNPLCTANNQGQLCQLVTAHIGIFGMPVINLFSPIYRGPMPLHLQLGPGPDVSTCLSVPFGFPK